MPEYNTKQREVLLKFFTDNADRHFTAAEIDADVVAQVAVGNGVEHPGKQQDQGKRNNDGSTNVLAFVIFVVWFVLFGILLFVFH